MHHKTRGRGPQAAFVRVDLDHKLVMTLEWVDDVGAAHWGEIQEEVLLGARGRGLGSAKLAKFCKFLAGSFSAVSKRNFARNMRLTAFFKLYKICIPLHRCNLKI